VSSLDKPTGFPIPSTTNDTFVTDKMVYAHLSQQGGSIYVDTFRVLQMMDDPGNRQIVFATALGAASTDTGQFDIAAGWLDYGYGADTDGLPQFFLPEQCYLAIHLDSDSLGWYAPQDGLKNLKDEGDANAALMYVHGDGSFSSTPNGGEKCYIAFFSVVRRGAVDMRPFLINYNNHLLGDGQVIDPTGGNAGGQPYPPPGGGPGMMSVLRRAARG
jgi:hypothetical protein